MTYSIHNETGTELARSVSEELHAHVAQSLANHLQKTVYVYSDDADADGVSYTEVAPNHTRMK